jgi:hypothetical protein
LKDIDHSSSHVDARKRRRIASREGVIQGAINGVLLFFPLAGSVAAPGVGYDGGDHAKTDDE